jgi:acyl carrier protein
VIEDDVRAIVAEVAELDASEIEPEVPLAAAGIDSLMAMEIAVEIERRYGVRFSEEELQEVGTFSSLVRLARRAIEQRDGAGDGTAEETEEASSSAR